MEDEEDNISNSVHALHNGDNNTSLRASQPSHTSPPSSQSRKKSPPKNLFKADSGSMMTSQTSAVSQDSNSPDFSTSSLISGMVAHGLVSQIKTGKRQFHQKVKIISVERTVDSGRQWIFQRFRGHRRTTLRINQLIRQPRRDHDQ